jgi:hypothetical protein
MIFHNLCPIEPPYVGNCIFLPENIPWLLYENEDWAEYHMEIISTSKETIYPSFSTYLGNDVYCFRKSRFKKIY